MILYSKFRPSWWLSNPHLQTLWAARLRRRVNLSPDTERLELPDGDFVDLVISRVTSHAIVCLFHGLEGGINSVYINRIFDRLERNGYKPILMHFRGCSGEPNRLMKSYHSGHTEDIRYFINTVVQRFQGQSVHAIGYSLGANALLKYLGEEGGVCPLQSAIAVSPPLVLQEGANRMRSGLSRLYQQHLLAALRTSFQKKRLAYPELNLPQAGPDLNTFWRFDNTITAPLNGFSDVHDYYTRCSSRQYLVDIEIPTHILFSRDDPFFTAAVIPDEKELSDTVTFELTEHGGHVAFISGWNPFRLVYWMENRLMKLLASN